MKLLARPTSAVQKSLHLPSSVEEGQMTRNVSVKWENDGEVGGPHTCAASGSTPVMIFILKGDSC